jgi:hypothetical protein
MAGAALLAMVFTGAILVWMREAAVPPLWVALAAVGGIVGLAGLVVTIGLLQATAFRVTAPADNLRSMMDQAFVMFNTGALGTVLFIIAVTVAMSGRWTPWLTLFGDVTALLLLVGVACVRAEGAISPQGAVPIAAGIVLVLWILAVSVRVLRGAPAGAAPATAA